MSVAAKPDLTQEKSTEILRNSRGPAVTEKTTFRFTIWYDGIKKPWSGKPYQSGIVPFARWFIEQRRDVLVQTKAESWFYCPITTADNYKRLSSVREVDALVLDADSCGSWDRLLDALDALDFSYVAYQTGGHTLEQPKWRIMFILAAPYDASTFERQERWKTIYHHARNVFGSLGGLSGTGFDHTVSCCANAWYSAERRADKGGASMPARQFVYRFGHSLDFEVLAASVPPPPPKAPRALRVRTEAADLDEKRIDDLVDRLYTAVDIYRDVPETRALTYLGITKALLDYGVDGDDVIRIVQEVSSLHDYNDERHSHNCRTARETVDDFERGDDTAANAGVLGKRFPEILDAIKEALPEVEAARKAAWLAQQQAITDEFTVLLASLHARHEAEKSQAAEPAGGEPIIPALQIDPYPTTQDDLDLVVEEMASIRRKVKDVAAHKPLHDALGRVLYGVRARSRTAEPTKSRVEDASKRMLVVGASGMTADEALSQVVGALAWIGPSDLKPDAIAKVLYVPYFESGRGEIRSTAQFHATVRTLFEAATKAYRDNAEREEAAERAQIEKHYAAFEGSRK